VGFIDAPEIGPAKRAGESVDDLGFRGIAGMPHGSEPPSLSTKKMIPATRKKLPRIKL